MAYVHNVPQGTLLPVLKESFADSAGVIDFTQFSSIAWTMKHNDGSPTVTGSATGDALGNVTYTWVAGDTATKGTYQGYFIGTTAGGKTQRFPTTGVVSVLV